jgi:S1-C subfamily serine protease
MTPRERDGEQRTTMTVAVKVSSLGCAALAVALTPTLARAQSDQASLKAFAVHINRTPQQPWPGYGVYLGNGLILTAAHVAGNVAQTKPHVVIAGQDLPATLIKQGSLESVDLTLLSIDGTKLPVGLQMRRTPLCAHPPYAGERVVVAIPEGTAPSKVLPRQAIPADLRGRFDTDIADVATTGNSGSGVFDAADLCLLGIISRKISILQHPLKLGAPVRATDIAKYFVPAAEIRAFIPQSVSF